MVFKKIDSKKRLDIYKLGIGTQTIALLFMWLMISLLIYLTEAKFQFSSIQYVLIIIPLAFFTAASNLGSSLMDISVGFDLAVDVLPEEELSLFNSRLKRLDLFTEVSAPVFAGLILTLLSAKFAFYGVAIIAILNLATFIPEYFLLRSTQSLKSYQEKIISNPVKNNFFKDFVTSLKKIKGKPYSLVIISYAFLWFSVLSPHGVLLTSYLKDGAKASEFTIGVFRGAGALFGLIPTFLFAYLKERLGLYKTSRFFIAFQFFCVLISAIFFFSLNNIYPFLILILFSRVGLYGFSIGETELRQVLIPKDQRGEVNGVANSITSMATVGLYLMGSLLGETANFGVMIIISVVAVLISLLLFLKLESPSQVIKNNS
ncbi:MAG: MFS transporter [Bdellovibrionales bacterium]|nr:MFS transporter [Bdellovibrionales bacterium]